MISSSVIILALASFVAAAPIPASTVQQVDLNPNVPSNGAGFILPRQLDNPAAPLPDLTTLFSTPPLTGVDRVISNRQVDDLPVFSPLTGGPLIGTPLTGVDGLISNRQVDLADPVTFDALTTPGPAFPPVGPLTGLDRLAANRRQVDDLPVFSPLTGGPLIGTPLTGVDSLISNRQVEDLPVFSPLTGGPLIGKPLTGVDSVISNRQAEDLPVFSPLTGGPLIGTPLTALDTVVANRQVVPGGISSVAGFLPLAPANIKAPVLSARQSNLINALIQEGKLPADFVPPAPGAPGPAPGPSPIIPVDGLSSN